MLTAIIVDDKKANIETLGLLVRNYCPVLEISGTATFVEDAYTLINKVRPDIVFLDIEMTDGTGFDLLHKFDELFFEVIFTTAYNQYAVQAFREKALDYLLKPVDIAALQDAVGKAEKQIKLKQANTNLIQYLKQSKLPTVDKISIPTLDGFLFISYQEIIRCEASGSYTNFYLSDGRKVIASMRLKECEDILPDRVFFRVHHSHIVNLNFVSKYVRGRGGYLLLQDGSTADVAVARKDSFLQAMKQSF
jgi:two-component system LytT family response regulator